MYYHSNLVFIIGTPHAEFFGQLSTDPDSLALREKLIDDIP